MGIQRRDFSFFFGFFFGNPKMGFNFFSFFSLLGFCVFREREREKREGTERKEMEEKTEKTGVGLTRQQTGGLTEQFLKIKIESKR